MYSGTVESIMHEGWYELVSIVVYGYSVALEG